MFYYSLPKYLSDKIDRVQKRALRTAYSLMHYNEALIESGRETLCARRQAACVKRFNLILDDPNHRFNELVPKSSSSLNYNLRKNRNFSIIQSSLQIVLETVHCTHHYLNHIC